MAFVALVSGSAMGQDDVWWSHRPIRKPAVPATAKFRDWAKSPIDRFVLAKLLDKGMEPGPMADRRTLLRRVYFDLIGLPPTPDEIEAFVKDEAPNAYEKVVDRLLASPRHGERWARHWLDICHFAETHGHDQDVPRPNAWPYRDYLIKSFNDDKPYRRFILEQIAGDALFPGEPQAIAALGFLAAGPWDESSLKDIRADTLDRKAAQYLDRDDMLGTVFGASMSTTIQCARCHDHKFDPIAQEEYYELQAVLAGVDRANRTMDIDPKVHAERVRLTGLQKSLKAGPTAVRALLKDAKLTESVVAWEKAQGKTAKDTWRILDPSVFMSAGGATPVKLADRSVRFEGKRPDKDTYVFESDCNDEWIRAVRLEVLSDPALPHRGPGRQDNGNLHLSEFRVAVAGSKLPVTIARAFADFNQDGWDITRAIDNQVPTAWGIYPAVGQSHYAVFVLKEPIKGPARLVFTLEQQHGGGHLIGRPRLAVTSETPSLASQPISERVRQALAKPRAQRTEAEQDEIAWFALKARADADLMALPAPQLVYAAASDFTSDGSFTPTKGTCRPVHMLRRGDIKRPLAEVKPGALSMLPGLERHFKSVSSKADESVRRVALAEWVADEKNPLTWRSIVNRVWHYHFGRGLVNTPSDFGKMGSTPTHPDLLDWLTATFQEDGGSLKKLHRRMVTSATYMQATRHHAGYAKIDADNTLLWRMNRTRLDAESVRDAVLAVSGKLDLTMGGPSVKLFVQSPGIHRTPKVDYLAFDPDSPGAHRRSIYRFVFRTVPDPLLDALDCPDASQFAPARAESLSALQALALLNDPFMVRMSQHFARRLAKMADTPEEQVRQAVRHTLGRDPSPRESEILTRHARQHGLANVCRLLFNCNEFMFVN
jgi:hypothetical protein